MVVRRLVAEIEAEAGLDRPAALLSGQVVLVEVGGQEEGLAELGADAKVGGKYGTLCSQGVVEGACSLLWEALAAAGCRVEDGGSTTYAEEGLEAVERVRRMGDVADGELGGVVLGSADDVFGKVLGVTGVAVVKLGTDPGRLDVAELDQGAKGVAGLLGNFLAEVVGAGDGLGEVAGAADAEIEARKHTIEGRLGLGLGLCLTG